MAAAKKKRDEVRQTLTGVSVELIYWKLEKLAVLVDRALKEIERDGIKKFKTERDSIRKNHVEVMFCEILFSLHKRLQSKLIYGMPYTRFTIPTVEACALYELYTLGLVRDAQGPSDFAYLFMEISRRLN